MRKPPTPYFVVFGIGGPVCLAGVVAILRPFTGLGSDIMEGTLLGTVLGFVFNFIQQWVQSRAPSTAGTSGNVTDGET